MPDPHRALTWLVFAALAAVAYLFSPYLSALLVAAVTAVLSWPAHAWLTRRLRGRRGPAAFVTLLALSVGVIVPAGPLLMLVSREVAGLFTQVSAGMEGGTWDQWLARADQTPPALWLASWSGDPFVVSNALRSVAAEVAARVANGVTQLVPDLVTLTFRAVLNVVIFYLASYAFLVRGPNLLGMVRKVSPLNEAYVIRLFEVFAQFARNVVFAGLGAATTQGAVATLGYTLAEVERPLLFGFLTSVLAFVPLVGTLTVWGPLVLLLLAEGRTGSAVFVALWSMALVGTVDNLVRPLLVKGRSEIPTVLIFLGVFGGLQWMGVIGILVGPVMVAMVMALLHIYGEERKLADG